VKNGRWSCDLSIRTLSHHCTVWPNHVAVWCHMTHFLMVLLTKTTSCKVCTLPETSLSSLHQLALSTHFIGALFQKSITSVMNNHLTIAYSNYVHTGWICLACMHVCHSARNLVLYKSHLHFFISTVYPPIIVMFFILDWRAPWCHLANYFPMAKVCILYSLYPHPFFTVRGWLMGLHCHSGGYAISMWCVYE